MIRVVLDTNVLVSAFRAPNGNEARALRAVREGLASICVSDDIRREYMSVLRRPKFGFRLEDLDDLDTFFGESAINVTPGEASPASPDPTDTKFIACAVAGSADFLVTGNRRHFPEPFYGDTLVVNARDFLSQLNDA